MGWADIEGSKCQSQTTSGTHQVDVADLSAVMVLFFVGDSTFAPLTELDQEIIMADLRQKVMG